MKNILFLTFLLLLPFVGALLLNRFGKEQVVSLRFAARLGLAFVLVTTGTAHFVQTDGMMKLLPPWVPLANELILFTGVLEIAAAVGLLVERMAVPTARCLILFLIAV